MAEHKITNNKILQNDIRSITKLYESPYYIKHLLLQFSFFFYKLFLHRWRVRTNRYEHTCTCIKVTSSGRYWHISIVVRILKKNHHNKTIVCNYLIEFLENRCCCKAKPVRKKNMINFNKYAYTDHFKRLCLWMIS